MGGDHEKELRGCGERSGEIFRNRQPSSMLGIVVECYGDFPDLQITGGHRAVRADDQDRCRSQGYDALRDGTGKPLGKDLFPVDAQHHQIRAVFFSMPYDAGGDVFHFAFMHVPGHMGRPTE